MTRARKMASRCVLAVLAASLTLYGVSTFAQQSDRAKHIGGKFMCMCGCSQVLTQCNHVGCQTSAAMLKELDQSVAKGDSEEAVTQMFLQEFGTKVYAEPPKSGLSLVAWALPSVYLVLGTILVIFVIVRWRGRPGSAQVAVAGAAPAGISTHALEQARKRVAQDTED